ncbi:BTAD domain-containing putative transcriptional regulator [Plantactinospora mayteni]|uniref:SARP family transcriptional regulator n=1 Tax=Plantactinospora mayteni TaxID=566021 RepID=A0ABQ4F1J1_9ACTN|nr:BTAD domain-containing putative transcriptional regulator [Plantactinospora mayteni]GIH00786.1 SARP family transcriptional regulator [Plantactinospora mayteni]
MEFRVLGPLEVRHAGTAVPLGGPRQRAVLAALLLHANEVVTAQRLAEAVWEAPTASPESNLRTYVAGLRSRLRRAGADDSRLVTETGGYLVRVSPGELDVETFHRLVDTARQAQSTADFARAARCYQDALRLWRGAPLDGLPVGAGLWAELARLAEHRLTAIDQHAEARLALGEHDGVISELRRVVLQHPLHENLWARLMLALCGAGRTAEALQTFQDARRVLRDQLGAEPGSELQELHRRILRREPPEIPAGPRAEPATAPRQLPSDVRGFAGRADELARLDAVLADAGEQSTAVAVCAVSGTAGVGKTTLAVHWAHRIARRFPDGQLYVNLRGFDPAESPVDPAQAVRGFLEALGVPPRRLPADRDAQVSLYRSLLAGTRTLVVLDNARDAAQVRPLLPGSAGCLVVVTSRTDLSALAVTEGADLITLEVLTADEARRVLSRRLGADRVGAEPDAVDEIIARCTGLPLALAVVAARAAGHPRRPLAALAAELREAAGSLDMFEGLDTATDVRAVLSWSYRTLGTPSARLFRLLGLHAGPDLTVPAAASLSGVPVPVARRLLTELNQAHLVTEHLPGRYAMHDLLRAHAAELAGTTDTEAERGAALRRILDHYLHTAHTADRLLEPHRDPLRLDAAPTDVVRTELTDPRQAMTWFRAERRSLLAAVDQATDLGMDRHAYELPWTLVTFLDRQGHWHDYLATQQAALGAARQLADRDGEARAHRFIGNALGRLGQDEAADHHLEQALALYAELGDLVGQARARRALCWSAGQRGQHAEALHHSARALELFRAAGHRTGEARALNAVGWYQAMLGEYRSALVHCEQALAIHRELGSRDGEASTLDSVGYIHHRLGDHRRATDCYQRALAIHRELGDRNGEVEALTHLGDTHHAAGDQRAARDAWQRALEILDEISHVDAESIRAKLRKAHASARQGVATR